MLDVPINKLVKEIAEVFYSSFGRTPQRQRLEDILNEAIELSRATDHQNLREEAGDLLASLLMLHTEVGLDPAETVRETLHKIRRRQTQYASLGRKLKIAILGGAFDPPTIGHLAVARFVLQSSKAFDEVWLVPCFRHLHNKQMVSAKHRFAMCEIATRNDNPIRVWDYEIVNQLGGSSYNFAKRLLAESYAHDKYDFSFIIGMDNANNFSQWHESADLERMMRFVIVPRQGETRKVGIDWYLQPPHLFLESETPLPETSSSRARTIIQGAASFPELVLSTEGLLDLEVVSYIVKHNLYA